MCNPHEIDELDRLLGPLPESSPAEQAPAATPKVEAPLSDDIPLDRSSPYFDPCKKCGGSGKFYGYSGRYLGPCYTCGGKGGTMRKTTNEERAAKRQSAEAKRGAREAELLADFGREEPELLTYLTKKAETFEFAASLLTSVRKYGYLTEKQTESAFRLMQKDAEFEERKARERARRNVSLDASRLFAAFEQAKANGLKKPVLRFNGFSCSLASAMSKNAGAIYVKDRGLYLGKIMDGRFMASYEATRVDGLKESIESAMVNPVEAARKYGRETGKCSCCGRTLTDPASIAAGIGPICAESWF